ncbi:MAG: B12-binding domain-containing radical SAM protein [Gammaproteobacteria bacterium]|nr:B12-binding domain-containing radical SAM protein [Gammaproteobacteria bacterium]
MKCALVIPAWAPEDIFPARTAGTQINYWQPLGTLYVGACLQRAGHEVRLFNGAFLTHAEILRQVAAFAPQVAGIYATTFGWPKALTTAADIKGLDRGIVTVAGGPYPIAVQERCLEGAGHCFDVVVTGEAEQTMVELLSHVMTGRDLEDVRGIAFRRGPDLIKTPPRPLLEDLDALPFPARELLGEAARYLPPPATYRRAPVATLITSRGCNRRCIFCFQIDKERKTGVRGVRMRGVDSVLAEIEMLLREGYREIKFLDDSFVADYDRAMRLTREIRRRQLDFTWFASACVNQVDRPLLQAMKDAGCWAILLGAESGVQKNLNTLHKGSTLDQIRQAVRTAKDVGLTVSTPFVFGIPGETYEDGLKTIEFALELDPDLANFHCLTPFPGTYLYEHRGRYGTVSADLSEYTYQGSAFVPRSLTREQIQSLRQIAFRRFYSRPAFLWRRIRALRSLRDLRVALQGIQSLFWLWVSRRLFRRARDATGTRPG